MPAALPVTVYACLYAAQSKYPGFGLVEPRIQLEFENLGMRLQTKDKVVLQGVSGEQPGSQAK